MAKGARCRNCAPVHAVRNCPGPAPAGPVSSGDEPSSARAADTRCATLSPQLRPADTTAFIPSAERSAASCASSCACSAGTAATRTPCAAAAAAAFPPAACCSPTCCASARSGCAPAGPGRRCRRSASRSASRRSSPCSASRGSSQAGLLDQLDRLGTNLLQVQAGQSFGGADSALPDRGREDGRAHRRRSQQVSSVASVDGDRAPQQVRQRGRDRRHRGEGRAAPTCCAMLDGTMAQRRVPQRRHRRATP